MEIHPALQLLRSDKCADGRQPRGSLILDSQGNLYGTTFAGGAASEGTVFELLRGTGGRSEKVLFDFCDSGCRAGINPIAGLTYAGASSGAPYDGASALYGTTFAGGTLVYGVVYALTPSAGQWNETVLHSFCSEQDCTDGGQPVAGVVLDRFGSVFGVTSAGGGGNDFGGVAFKLSRTDGGAWTQTVLHHFCALRSCGDGGGPTGGMIFDAGGNLLGTADHGPGNGGGTVFRLAADGARLNVLHDFCAKTDCRDGSIPIAGLAVAANGALLGTTNFGGGKDGDGTGLGGGTVFALGKAAKVLHAFCAKPGCADGKYPLGAVMPGPGGAVYGMTSAGGTHGGGTVFTIMP